MQKAKDYRQKVKDYRQKVKDYSIKAGFFYKKSESPLLDIGYWTAFRLLAIGRPTGYWLLSERPLIALSPHSLIASSPIANSLSPIAYRPLPIAPWPLSKHQCWVRGGAPEKSADFWGALQELSKLSLKEFASSPIAYCQ